MLTCALPPKTGFSVSSEWIIRLFFLSCSPWRLMYAHNFFVTSVRGIGFEPTTSESAASGATGFMNAAFGFLLLFAFLAISSPCDVCVGPPSGAPALAALLCSVPPLCTSAVFETGGVIGHASRGADLQRAAQGVGNRLLGHRAGVHEHIDGFGGDDDAIVAGNSELGADRKGSRAEARGRDRQLQHLVVARRRLPLDRLLHELEVERPVDEIRQHAGRAQKLGDADVHVVRVAGVEDDFLRVAFDVADAEVIAERWHRRCRQSAPACPERARPYFLFTQSASVFHSGSLCDSQCLPPGWNSVPPASCASGITSSRLLSGTPGSTKRDTAAKFLRDSSSVYAARPFGSGWSRKAVLVEWHVMQRAWPGRFSARSGSTFCL